MGKIPTAEEVLNRDYTSTKENAIQAMIKFAKLHVKAALKAALEEVPYGSSTDTVSYEDVEGILSCYPESNIV